MTRPGATPACLCAGRVRSCLVLVLTPPRGCRAEVAKGGPGSDSGTQGQPRHGHHPVCFQGGAPVPRTPTTLSFPVCLAAGRGATLGHPNRAFLYLFWDISAHLILFKMPAGGSSVVPAVLLVWARVLLMRPAPPPEVSPGPGAHHDCCVAPACWLVCPPVWGTNALSELPAMLSALLAPPGCAVASPGVSSAVPAQSLGLPEPRLWLKVRALPSPLPPRRVLWG